MKIAYCGNYFAFDGLLISIISIMKHNKQTIDFYIITADLQNLNPSYKPITNEQILFLRSLIKSTNKMNSINFIDITQQYKNIFMKHNNSNPRFTPYANLRLLFDYVLPQDINKILYLDIDVICNNNLQEMWNINISQYEIGCVKDAFAITTTYFNSGVLLMNLIKMKQNNTFEKVRNYLFHKKFLIYADQAALNKIIQNKLMLDIKYNYKNKRYYPEIILHHFTNVRHWLFHRIKPWEVKLVKMKMNAYDDILDQYLSIKTKHNYLF